MARYFKGGKQCEEPKLTKHDHPVDPPLLNLLPKLGIVNRGVHVGGEDGVVGLQVILEVCSSVLCISGRIDDGPDVHGRVAQGEALIIQNLHSLRSAWKKSLSFHFENGSICSPSSFRENMI